MGQAAFCCWETSTGWRWKVQLPHTWSALSTASTPNPEPGREAGIEAIPRVTQDLIYVGSASSEVWLGTDKRLRGRREEESERWRKEARPLIALPRTGIIYRTRFILSNLLQGSSVYWEVYLSTRLSLTPAGMWKYVWSRLNFIYEQTGPLEPSSSLVMEAQRRSAQRRRGKVAARIASAGGSVCSSAY